MQLLRPYQVDVLLQGSGRGSVKNHVISPSSVIFILCLISAFPKGGYQGAPPPPPLFLSLVSLVWSLECLIYFDPRAHK